MPLLGEFIACLCWVSSLHAFVARLALSIANFANGATNFSLANLF